MSINYVLGAQDIVESLIALQRPNPGRPTPIVALNQTQAPVSVLKRK
jgi:hypothetical protein